MPFLDQSGLAHFWNHIVARLNTKVESAKFDEFEESMIEQINNIDLSLYETTEDAQAKLDDAKSYTDTALAGKSDTSHNHDSVYSKLGHTHTASEVGATTQTYVDNQIKEAKSYTDTKVAGLEQKSQVQIITWEADD